MKEDLFSELREDELGILHGGVCKNNTNTESGSPSDFLASNGNCLGVDGVIPIQIARELARDVTFKFFITFQIVTIISMVTI